MRCVMQGHARSPGVVADGDEAYARTPVHDRTEPSLVIHDRGLVKHVQEQFAYAAHESQSDGPPDRPPGRLRDGIVHPAFLQRVHRLIVRFVKAEFDAETRELGTYALVHTSPHHAPHYSSVLGQAGEGVNLAKRGIRICHCSNI